MDFRKFCVNYYRAAFPSERPIRPITEASIEEIQNRYLAIREKLSAEKWAQDEYRQELLLAAEAVCLTAELFAAYEKKEFTRLTDTEGWLAKFRAKWTAKNKESELFRIEDFFRGWENL